MSSLRLIALGASVALGGIFVVAVPHATSMASQGPQLGPATGEPVSGIKCDAMEGQRVHIHQHLVVLDHGRDVTIPANIGIVGAKNCLYWLHTHTSDGFIHIETPVERTFTLGEFFKIWGQPLSRAAASSAHAEKGASLKVWVDGKPYTKDPNAIPLAAHTDIVIQAGPPFTAPARFTNWGKL